jgi:hypothetical protein
MTFKSIRVNLALVFVSLLLGMPAILSAQTVDGVCLPSVKSKCVGDCSLGCGIVGACIFGCELGQVNSVDQCSVECGPDNVCLSACLETVACISNNCGAGLIVKPDEASFLDPSAPATINSKSRGTIPVAILGRVGYDPSDVLDLSTIRFGETGDENSLAFCSGTEDVNGDGIPDLVCHFDTRSTGLKPGDTNVYLKARTRVPDSNGNTHDYGYWAGVKVIK